MDRPETSPSKLLRALLCAWAVLLVLAPLQRLPAALHAHHNDQVAAHDCADELHVTGEHGEEGPHPCAQCELTLTVSGATPAATSSVVARAALVEGRLAAPVAAPVFVFRPAPPPARGPPAS